MKLQKISMANYRGFEQLDVQFDPNVTVIAGVNGVGKSGLLHALTILFSQALPKIAASKATAMTFEPSDIRVGKENHVVSIEYEVQDNVIHEVYQYAPEGMSIHGWHAETTGGNDDQTDAEAYTRATELASELKKRPDQPLVIFFSTRRQLPGTIKTIPKPEPYEVKQAYVGALRDREVALREFVAWFHAQEVLSAGDAKPGRRQKTIQRVRSVVTSFLPEFENLRIEHDPVRMVVEKAGVPLAINQLSDGERGLLAMLFDITRRLSIANPQLNDPVADGQAIILVDEIELHLHPVWQRQVIERFTETFRNCQFVVTTHSPLLLGEVAAKSVRFLYREDGRVKCYTPSHALGLSVNRILEEFMQVDTRDTEVQSKLDELFRSIDDEKFETARAKIEKLAEVIGESDPELIRAKSMLAFLEGIE